MVADREVLLRGRLRTVDLLVLTSLDQLIFIENIFLFTKQATWMRRSTVLSLPPSVSIPWLRVRSEAYLEGAPLRYAPALLAIYRAGQKMPGQTL
jgi:hypothetical protein